MDLVVNGQETERVYSYNPRTHMGEFFTRNYILTPAANTACRYY